MARAFALFLIALGVTPFTAPFAVCDLADLTGTPSSYDDAGAAKDTIKEQATVATPIVVVSDESGLSLQHQVIPADRIDLRIVRALVLRI